MRILFVFFSICLWSTSALTQPDYKSWDVFLKKYVSNTGEVDYKNIKANEKELHAIIKIFSSVSVSASCPKNEQLAFWINAYNAFTIHLIVSNYPVKSIQNLDNGKTWDIKRINIGGKLYSLNNIENDIIRKQFNDARIHFAVNCAAKSCPPILNGAFFGKTLDSQLDMVTKMFINNPKYQTISSSKLSLSKIFEWYKSDFGSIDVFINTYSKIKVNKNAAIVFKEYDWTLNGK